MNVRLAIWVALHPMVTYRFLKAARAPWPAEWVVA